MENNFILNIATSLPGFLLAIIAHEYAHAWVALKFGDTTAKDYGRLTFHPAPHIDLIGTVLFPILGAAIGGIAFGWAKPVPIDSRRFRHFRKGVFWVSFAGPLANVLLSVLFAFSFALVINFMPRDFIFTGPFALMFKQAVFINILLAVFNLIPIPPLDGSKMVSSFLSTDAMMQYQSLARYSFVFFLMLMFTNIWSYILMPFIRMGEMMLGIFVYMLR